MAAYIYCCGEKGHRYITKNSTLMMHEPRMDLQDSVAEDLARHAKHVAWFKDIIYDIVSKRTKLTKKRLAKDLTRDFILNSEMAMKNGIADQLLDYDCFKSTQK